MGWVGVVVDPTDYEQIQTELENSGGLTIDLRKELSAKAFRHTAQYDAVIAQHFSTEELPEDMTLTYAKTLDLRYGENPHQQAAAYRMPVRGGFSILNAKIHQGKQLSYNNIMDGNGALACLREFDQPAVVVVKHANPCGVAIGEKADYASVYQQAFDADAKSAFGGIIALNRCCTAAVAERISKVFVEIVMAPEFELEALSIIAKKKNLRVLETGPVPPRETQQEIRYIDGGLLVQDSDTRDISKNDLEVVTDSAPTDDDINTMLFAWKVLKHVKSNAILIAKDNVTVGIGPGQVSRVDAVEIALRKAGDRTRDGILASDAFFPFRDNIDILAGSGIRAVIQPGGSIRDQEIIDACNEHDIAMVFTGTRCF